MKFHSQILKFSYSQIAFAIFAWSLLILRFGYRFGTGDQVELLPYTLFLSDPTLYPHDFFIQGLHASVPNERTVMAMLLRPFVNHLEVTCLVLHFLSTVILVLGLEKLARRFIQNQHLAWLAVLVALIPLNDFALGNVELYSDCFQASALAVAIVVWAINLFLDKKYLPASVLTSAGTFIQLLEGLDVMMVLCTLLFIAALKKEVTWKTFAGFVAVYALTAGIYLVVILQQKNVANAELSQQQLFSILFQFRHPHHFIFASFPKGKMIVFFLLSVVALLFYWLRNRPLLHFILIGFTGVLVYAFFVDGLHNIFIGNFQFYKITQWLKFMGVVAVFGLVGEVMELKGIIWNKLKFETGLLVTGVLVCWLVVLNFNSALPYKVPFQLFGMKDADPMIDICQKAKNTTPGNAVFIVPFENTEFKFYAERSAYVEFKANVRNKLFVKQWAERVNEVYGVGPGMNVKGFALQQQADSFFYTANTHRLNELKQKGVTHLLTKRGLPSVFGNLVVQNETYAVYKL